MLAKCVKCGKLRNGNTLSYLCQCGGIYQYEPDFKYHEGNYMRNYPYLSDAVSLGETQTPILDMGDLMLKLEYFSPTYSYKDRGTKALISYLKSRLPNGARINEDSSGNAGASISAYGAAAGFAVNIFVPEKTVASKVKQIELYGAKIHKVPGSREDVSTAARNAEGYFASHVYNPEFRDGMREISYEIFRQAQAFPDFIFVPVSAGTLILGVISGFKHLLDSGEIAKLPRFVAVQTEAVKPLCARMNNLPFDPKAKVSSIADALVSREPPLLELMYEALSGVGACITVPEEEIMQARLELASKGVLVEYSSATVFAAQKKFKGIGKRLLIMTGNGLKNL